MHYDLHAGERSWVREPPYYGKIFEREDSGFTQRFYVCGQDSFVADIKSILKELGASPDSVVFEE